MVKPVLRRGHSLHGEEAFHALGFMVAARAVNSIRLGLQMLSGLLLLVVTLELGEPGLPREAGLFPQGSRFVPSGRGCRRWRLTLG